MQDRLEWEWHVVSHHEAGHAVAGIALGLPVAEVIVNVSGGLLGGVSSSGNTVAWMPDHDDTDGINRSMVSDLCGAAAEARFYMTQGFRVREAHRIARGNATGDYTNATELLEHATLDLAEAETAADDLVTEYWDAITDVARALREAGGYLSGEDVETIFLGVTAA